MGFGLFQKAVELRSMFGGAILLLVWQAPYDNMGRIFVMLVKTIFSYYLVWPYPNTTDHCFTFTIVLRILKRLNCIVIITNVRFDKRVRHVRNPVLGRHTSDLLLKPSGIPGCCSFTISSVKTCEAILN